MNVYDTILQALDKADRKNPLSIEDISELIDVCEQSYCRKLISDMRDMGIPVISYQGRRGYWLAKTEEDMDKFCKSYTANAVKRLRRAEEIRRQWFLAYNERMVFDEIQTDGKEVQN